MEEAAKRLARAEEIDMYRELCTLSPSNYAARHNTSYTPWPDQQLAEQCKRELRLMGIDDTSISVIILHPSADGGMPHTRATDVICIPAYFPEKNLRSTLRHELVHIDQRRRPLYWKTLLQKKGWEPIRESESGIPRDIFLRCRFNPDTIASPYWIYKKRWIPLPLFERMDRPSMREVSIRWWDRYTGSFVNTPPADFAHLKGAALEHPYEMEAYQT